MDILNWLYLAKNKFVRTTPSSEKDLMVFGAKVGVSKRGDIYQNYAMSIEDLATAIIPPAPTPAYKVYTARVSQNGTNPPIATVIENTLGITGVFTYVSTGSYQLTFSGLFPIAQGENKTAIFYNNQVDSQGVVTCTASQTFPSTSTFALNTRAAVSFGPYTAGQAYNGIMNGTIEIRVYN